MNCFMCFHVYIGGMIITRLSPGVCGTNMSYCVGSQSCMPQSWWCDSKVDCPSGEDEGLNCPYADCSHDTFECAITGKCISLDLRCNGHYDCETISVDVTGGLEADLADIDKSDEVGLVG